MDALLDRLAELIPPPADPPAVDWREVESRWGTPLPPDYRAFRERWGPGAVQGTLDVHDEETLADWVRDAVRDFVDDGDAPPRPLFPQPGGALVWGSTESRWMLFWRTDGPPEDWRVVLLNDAMEWIDTDLRFAEWLLAALEGRLSSSEVPPELEQEDDPEFPPLGARGHRWFGDRTDDGEERDAATALDPHSVLQTISADDAGDGSANAVSLDLGRLLGRPRDEALEAFLGWLAGHDAALRDEVADARAKASREELELRSAAAVPGVARAAATFAAEELGVPLADPEFLDFLFDEDWPPEG